MRSYPTPQAVVLANDGVFYDTGKHVPLSPRLKLSDTAAVLAGAAQIFRAGEGVIVIDAAMPDPTTFGVLISGDRFHDGWRFTELRPWTTFSRDGVTVHVGWLPDLTAKRLLGALLDGHDGPADIANRLGRYAMLIGVPWRYTAGVSACAALRARFTDPRNGSQPLWRHKLPAGIRGAGPLIWRAKEQPAPGTGAIVHSWDINAMYLAGIKNAQVAWGPLIHARNIGFDQRFPGFWELSTGSLPAELLDGITRPPAVNDRLRKGSVWVSTDVAKYISGRAGSLDVLDAYVSENPQAIGRSLAERWIAARNGDMGPAGPAEFALKRTYAEMVGMCARPGGSIDRADWAAAWMDLSRVNMLRRTDRVGDRFGIWPVAVQTDAVYYVQPADTDPGRVVLAAVLGEGSAPGLFKYQGAMTVDAYRAKFGLAA